LFIKFQGAWRDVAYSAVMEPLGMATRHPEQSRDCVFGDVDQTGRGAHPASVAQMVDDRRRLFLRDLRVEQRGAPSLGELLAARPAAQEPQTIMAVDFAHAEIVLTGETKPLAFGIDTR
jgi:hypothetical protein